MLRQGAYDDAMNDKSSILLCFVLLTCGVSCQSALVSPGSTLIRARPAVAQAAARVQQPCPEMYVEGARGRYRATGCGMAETYICNADVSTANEPIECAREHSARAMTLRYQWRRAHQSESYFWPRVSGVISGRGKVTASGLSYGSVEKVGPPEVGARAIALPAPQ